MTDNLESGTYEIISHTHGSPLLGVNYTQPAWQNVHLDAPNHLWKIKHVGDHRYLLSLDWYPRTGVLDDKVIASIYEEHEEEWEITDQEHHNAFTIALAKKPEYGWTVQKNDAYGHEIGIKPIIATDSFPPQFSPSQLFSIKKHN